MRHGPLVLVARTEGPDGTDLAVRTATALLGQHPGPLHHRCPVCGSIEHGQPTFDAPVAVSITHSPGLTLVAVTTAAAVGVDVEAEAEADLDWVEEEAVAKALGTGLSGLRADRTGLVVLELRFPGHVAAIAVRTDDVPEIRMLPEAPAGAAFPATP